MDNETKLNRLDTQILALAVLAVNIAHHVSQKRFSNDHGAIQVEVEKITAWPLIQLLEDLLASRNELKPIAGDPDEASFAKAQVLVKAFQGVAPSVDDFKRANADIPKDFAFAKPHLENQRPAPKIGFTANKEVSVN